MTVRSQIRLTLPALQVLLLIACGGGGGSHLTPASYTIGGTVTGLGTGQQVVLANNGGDRHEAFRYRHCLLIAAGGGSSYIVRPAGMRYDPALI